VTTAILHFGAPIEMTSPPVLAGFAGLYERHYEAVFRAALRVTGSPADAEDVLQTVFLRLLSQRDKIEGDEAAGRPAAYFRRAIATLDREDATLFVLRYVEGLSNQELADVFQLEKNNVAVRLHRIRLRLQAEMAR